MNKIIVTLKYFFQKLCTHSLSGDDTLPHKVLPK